MSSSLREVLLDVEPLDPQLLQLLSKSSTATLAGELFATGFRNTFMRGVRPLNPAAAHFVGEAFTLRYIPAREDLDVVEGFADPDHPQRKAIESLGPGQVLVIDCRGETHAGALGHILITRMMKRGAVGVVTDGSVRDSPAVAQMAFPVFCAGGAAPLSLTLHHAVDYQRPIGCGGVAVFPGDILVGDEEGVVVVPRDLVAPVAEGAAQVEDLEAFLLGRIEQGATLPGTYPPDEETQAAYREHRGQAH